MFRVIVSIMLGLMLSLLVAGSGEALAARDHCASAPGITQIHVNQDCAPGHQTDPPPLKWSDLKYVLWHQGGSEHAKEEAHA